MKKILFFTCFVGCLVFLGNSILSTGPVEAEVETTELEVIVTAETYTIAEGDTFTVAMEALGFPYADALAMVAAGENIFDLTKVKLGKDISLISEDGVPMRIEYEPNSEEVVIIDLQNDFAVSVQPIAFDITVKEATGTIDGSLSTAMMEQGLPELLVIKFADVLAWEIDFATQVQNGDSFRVLYEERSRDGSVAGIGNILRVEFTNRGNTTVAYQYTKPDGDTTYYSEDGSSLVRPFLKAPMSYTRITSGFSMARFHPVTGRTAPHRAIDYAAPTGTPIMAVADGTVTFAGWSAIGYGNFIKIKHNGIYGTNYAHLSAFNVSPGDVVKQGDVIGYVGSTGFSTGPHLHYEVTVYGELKNPLEVEFPKGDALPEEERSQFEEQKRAINAMLN